ncbi:alpha/beta hydrolase [Dongia sp.]|uniref:alpha/beta hydrolase n=1 Tax=Dongia sp. TaxID=1977262 RepID=UPI0037505ED4
MTSDDGYRLSAGLPYGEAARQALDVYRPDQPRANPAPVVVFFYGGYWNSGERADYRFVGQLLAAEGFVVVIADYRLYPAVRYPAFLEDGAAALRWTQDRIAGYGGDPQRIFLMGHSAGAYNAMMLGLDRRYGSAAGFDAGNLCGIVGLAGPFDFAFDTDLLRGVFAAARDPAEALPITYAGNPGPPVLLVTGGADDTVDPSNSVRLERRLAAAGHPVRRQDYPGLDHIDVVLQFSSFWTADNKMRRDVIDFLGRCPGRPAR